MTSKFVFLNNFINQIEIRIFFHFILILLLSVTLISIFSNRKLIFQATYRRAISTLLLILGLQILFFAGLSLIFRFSLLQEPFLLSYFRFIFSISALWIIWIWSFPLASMKSESPKYVFGIALTIIFIIQLFFIYLVRIINIETTSILNTLWFLTTLVSLMLGLFLLVINHHTNWFIGFIFALIHLVGILTTQLLPGITQSQAIAILFLAQIIAFPFLPVVAQSLIYTNFTEEKQVRNKLPIASKNMAILPARNIFQAWLSLAIKNQDTLITNEFLKSLNLTFHSDMALLLSASNQLNDLIINSGFSNNKTELVFPFPIDNNCISYFKDILKGKRPFYLSADDYFPNELIYFLDQNKIPQPVNILFFPVKLSAQSNNSFCIILLSSLLRWDKTHLDYLRNVKDELAQILQKIYPEKVISDQQTKKTLSSIDPENLSINTKMLFDKTSNGKILRLESELKFALEEYARVQKLLEEKINRSNSSRKSN